MGKKKSTRTSSFGVKGRENHDASPFYSRALYSEFSPQNLPRKTSPKIPSLKIFWIK
ncbi:hypothetical protein [Thermotoga sp. SG1]|uniref:hypothetical protein n=1 Tax=Thermotoga sp. SG1 TaxID=126739 RepID=UPI001E50EA60|nr:hypothetical protein [Thermotoga sp. SG1]